MSTPPGRATFHFMISPNPHVYPAGALDTYTDVHGVDHDIPMLFIKFGDGEADASDNPSFLGAEWMAAGAPPIPKGISAGSGLAGLSKGLGVPDVSSALSGAIPAIPNPSSLAASAAGGIPTTPVSVITSHGLATTLGVPTTIGTDNTDGVSAGVNPSNISAGVGGPNIPINIPPVPGLSDIGGLGGGGASGTHYYILDPLKPMEAVDAGKWLEVNVLKKLGLEKANPDGTGDWYKIRAPVGVSGRRLAADMLEIADIPSITEFGFLAASAIFPSSQGILQVVQAAATVPMNIQANNITKILTRKAYY